MKEFKDNEIIYRSIYHITDQNQSILLCSVNEFKGYLIIYITSHADITDLSILLHLLDEFKGNFKGICVNLRRWFAIDHLILVLKFS